MDVRQQRGRENAGHPVSLPGVMGTPGSNSTASHTPEMGDKPAPQGGVEMAAAMAAKINAMLMAKGKLLTPPPLLAKVINLENLFLSNCWCLFLHYFQDLQFSLLCHVFLDPSSCACASYHRGDGCYRG